MRLVLRYAAPVVALSCLSGCSHQAPTGEAYHYSPPIPPTFKNLSYGDKSPKEKLDLYLPAPGRGPAPLVIWIHGGGFRAGDKGSMPLGKFGPPSLAVRLARLVGLPFYQVQVPDVAALVAKGYAVVSLNYRLLYRPGTKFTPIAQPAVQDGKAAVRFLRANAEKYHLDPDKFAVWGNSAGGFISAMLGVTGDQATVFDDPSFGNANVSSAVQAVVVWYGAIDADSLLPEIRIFHYIPSAKILPPFLIANGDADTSVKVTGAQSLNQALLERGAQSSLNVVHGAGHEDPAFMTTQMVPAFNFLDKAFGR